MMRGMDSRDSQKDLRDRVRYQIAYEKDITNNPYRPDTFDNNPKDIKTLSNTKPVISKRASDIKDQVLEGRKKAQYNKANSPFMKFSQPVDGRIQQGTFF